MNPLSNSLSQAHGLHFSGKRKLLVADDGPTNIAMHVKYIEKCNKEQPEKDQFDITVATDGQEALEKLNEAEAAGTPFDILITDNDMPRKKGLDLIKALIHRPFTVMISSDNIETEAKEAGANAYYTKPASLNNFRDIFKQYFGMLTAPLPAAEPMAPNPLKRAHTTVESSIETQNPFEREFAVANKRNKH